VDRLDFLVRDAYATGLQLGFVNSLLIIDLMVPFEDEQGRIFLAFRERPALDFLEHFLYARRLMYSRCYERDSKVSAEGMLILAVQDFLPKSVGQPVVDDLMLLDDELLLDMILASNDPSSKSVQIAKLLKLGRVYSKVYEVHKKDSPRLQDWITNEARKSTSSSQFVIPYVNWRMEIAKGAGLNFEEMGWKILAVPPSPNVYREVDIDINILEEAPGGYGLRPASELSPTLENVQKTVQEAQQVVRVFVHPYLEKETTDRIETSAKKYFTE
jgi:HD superfamily phosphohydrolase